MWVEKNDGHHAAMVAFYPTFDSEESVPDSNLMAQQTEFVFVVDRSASMAGDTMRELKVGFISSCRKVEALNAFNSGCCICV